MIELDSCMFENVSGGDRWGDGQDQKNHPDSNNLGSVCTPVDNPINGSGWEVCVIVRKK